MNTNCEECNQELDYDTVSGVCEDCLASWDKQDREAEKDRRHDEMVALGYV
jgi:uncharacterized Zn ribbon protein